jgi:NAD(P)-dependent dehydrogenase (short-subunit alcohol dehydrogenase family)
MHDVLMPTTTSLLSNRVILVTGASGGLGSAAARAFAAHGATVVLHGRDAQKLEALYDEIKNSGAEEPALLPLDLQRSVGRDFDHVVHILANQLGRLDGILHSAVHLEKLSPLADQTLDEWERVLRVNLLSPLMLTRACLPLLRAATNASVIYTLEEHALSASPLWGSFAATGAALASAARIQASELDGNPRVNVLIPGPVESPLRRETHPGESSSSRARPESLMRHYVYLMSTDSANMNGEIVRCQP